MNKSCSFHKVKEWMRAYGVKACETEECLVKLVLICRKKKPGSWKENGAQQRQDAAAVQSEWRICQKVKKVGYCI